MGGSRGVHKADNDILLPPWGFRQIHLQQGYACQLLDQHVTFMAPPKVRGGVVRGGEGVSPGRGQGRQGHSAVAVGHRSGSAGPAQPPRSPRANPPTVPQSSAAARPEVRSPGLQLSSAPHCPASHAFFSSLLHQFFMKVTTIKYSLITTVQACKRA